MRSRRKKKKLNRVIKKSILRIVALLMIAGLNWTGFLATGQTLSYFNDTEVVPENSLAAGVLDIFLDSSEIYVSDPLYPTDTAMLPITVLNNGTLVPQYISNIVALTGDTDPCDYVDLDATNGTQNYSGPLLGFNSTASELVTPTNWNYTFKINSLAPPSVWGKTCYFKWGFTAWDKDTILPINGFIDTEEKSGGIRIGKTIVLNEILADPAGSDTALKPGGEWVELYNNSNIDFDVAGWVIYDSDDSHELYIENTNTNTGNTIVPAHGFLAIYRNGDGDFNLNNDTDSVRLFTGYPVSSSVLVDSYSWTTAKPEGFSFARIPDGVGDWVDPVPTPGQPNILNGEINDIFSDSEIFYPASTEISEPEILEIQEELVEQPAEEIITEETVPIEEVVPEVVEEPEQEPVIEQTPVVEPEPVIVPPDPTDDNSGSGDAPAPADSGETVE